MTFYLLVVSIVCTRPAATATLPPRNPLDLILAANSDDRSPTVHLEPDPTPGALGHLANVHDGDFTLYRALDLDSGVAAFKAVVAGPRSGTLELHLDTPTSPVYATCPFQPSGGWNQWQDITANVDNSQAGVRDLYLVFRSPSGEKPNSTSLVNLQSFVFLKSVVTPTTGAPDLASRLDSPTAALGPAQTWGVPAGGFGARLLNDNWRDDWKGADDLQLTPPIPDSLVGVRTDGKHPLFAYAPAAYINPTDSGGEWRTLAEGTFSAILVADTPASRPGIGFTSDDGRQAIYVTLDPEHNALEAWRQLRGAPPTLIHRHASPPPGPPAVGSPPPWSLLPGDLYTVRLDWSPYANALLVRVTTGYRQPVANFRTVIDLPAARHPLLVNSGGPATFGGIHFDPEPDIWTSHWEWYKQPILTPDVCNPAVWRGPNGQMYMLWRKFGADNFHGIAKSEDGVHWTRVTDEAIKCTGDMTVLPDPFGDGKWYATPGGNNLPWWTSDGTDDFRHWTQTNLTVGDIHGHNRIQEIIDTQVYPQLHPVHFNDHDYRFIAYCEDWVHAPQPHSVVLLSNTLTDWVQPSPDPVIPPSTDFWGEKGNAIGSAFPLPDGNILLCDCACTNAGYTGAPEPSNVTAIVSNAEPWKLMLKAVLPVTPVSRENVWYQGPNFGTAFFYDEKQDTLFLYGGFHDYSIGVQRIRHFLHPVP